MDTEVQRYLLKNFPIVEGKIKLFNHETKQDIEDPVKYAKEDYYKCMNKILELAMLGKICYDVIICLLIFCYVIYFSIF